MDNTYGHFCRPGLVPLLESIGLDATYERAEGDYLWRRDGSRLVKVLDLLGGYGANLFGHHHPELAATARRLLGEQVPMLAQASCRTGAAQLAEELCRRLGDYVVTFTNSGAETVEAAAKHCLMERPQGTFWAVKGAFHGKTLGAIQFTWSYRDAYRNYGPPVYFLDPLNPDTWHEALKHVDRVSGIFLEPIAGEGGIRPLPAPFVSWITAVCRETGIPLVVDEIQSGMGRTGTFLASEAMGITPDYICLSKALGGGLAKIGALLVKRERYVDEFSVTHTSTFAEDDFSCGIALEALKVLDRDRLPTRCSERGAFLLQGLETLRSRFPEQIKEVRGAGLMVGIEFHEYPHGHSYSLRALSEQERLGYVAASYLLNEHHIRIAPTLSEPLTLRVEPSAYVQERDLQRFIDATTNLCEALKAGDLGHLTRFQIGLPAGAIVNYRDTTRLYRREIPRTSNRVAFLGHLLLDQHLELCDPSLKTFETRQFEAYLDKSARLMGPTIFDQVHVRSQTGEEVHLSFIGLGLTSRQIVQAMRGRDARWIIGKIEDAVVLAREAGCSVIGLGGYTSIVTANCLRVKTEGIVLTSGNSLTVGMGLEAIHQAVREKGIQLSDSSLAVVGAAGNIASTYALMMAGKVAELVLVVHNLASPKTEALRKAIRNVDADASVRITDRIEDIADCAVVVTASNTPEPLVYPRHLRAGPVVICDISVPADVADEVMRDRPDVFVIQGGVVKLPYNDNLVIGAIPLTEGHVFACMAETLLMGLEESPMRGSIGPIRPPDVLTFLNVAAKHGFGLGDINAHSPSNSAMSLAHAQVNSRAEFALASSISTRAGALSPTSRQIRARRR